MLGFQIAVACSRCAVLGCRRQVKTVLVPTRELPDSRRLTTNPLFTLAVCARRRLLVASPLLGGSELRYGGGLRARGWWFASESCARAGLLVGSFLSSAATSSMLRAIDVTSSMLSGHPTMPTAKVSP
jgi:hypothetical protein